MHVPFEPTTLALLAQYSIHRATGAPVHHKIINYKKGSENKGDE